MSTFLHSNSLAQFNCSCQQARSSNCPIEGHKNYYKENALENNEYNSENSRGQHTEKNIKKKIDKIKKLKKQIISGTNSVVKLIQEESKKILKKLDNYQRNFALLNRKNNNNEDKIDINDFDIKMKFIEIINQMKKIFSQEFFKDADFPETAKSDFNTNYNGGFLCGVVTSDLSTLITGGIDSIIRVWDISQKYQKFILEGHSGDVKCITLIEDRQYLVSGSLDGSVIVWNLQEKSQLKTLKDHKAGVYSICYMEKLSLIISGDSRGKLIIWNTNNDFKIVKRLKSFKDITTIYTIVKYNSTCIIGLNKSIKTVELENFSVQSKNFSGHNGVVSCIVLNKNGKIMFSGSWDAQIIIWDFINARKLEIINELTGQINSLILTLDERLLISGSDDKNICVWNMDGTLQKKFNAHKSCVNVIIQKNQGFITLSQDGRICVFENETKDPEISHWLNPAKYLFIEFLSKSGLFGFGSNNKIVLWDLSINKEFKHNDSSKSCFLKCGSNSWVWDLDTLKDNDSSKYINSVEISTNGQYMLACLSYKILYFIDLKMNLIPYPLERHKESVYCACFSENNLTAASGSADKNVILWDLETKKSIHIFKGHTDKVYSIKFINKKNFLVSAGEDKTIIIWDISNKTYYKLLKEHINKIYRVFVSDDEKYIISGAFEDGIIIWDCENFKKVTNFKFQSDAKNWFDKNGAPLSSVKKFLIV